MRKSQPIHTSAKKKKKKAAAANIGRFMVRRVCSEGKVKGVVGKHFAELIRHVLPASSQPSWQRPGIEMELSSVDPHDIHRRPTRFLAVLSQQKCCSCTEGLRKQRPIELLQAQGIKPAATEDYFQALKPNGIWVMLPDLHRGALKIALWKLLGET